MNKKILVAFSFIILIVLFSQNVIIAGDYISEESLDNVPAEEIVSEFIDIRNSIGLFFGWFEGGNTKAYLENVPETDMASGRPSGVPEWNCYVRVRNGYGPDDVKKRIRDLFIETLAEKIINDSETFFLVIIRKRRHGTTSFMADILNTVMLMETGRTRSSNCLK